MTNVNHMNNSNVDKLYTYIKGIFSPVTLQPNTKKNLNLRIMHAIITKLLHNHGIAMYFRAKH